MNEQTVALIVAVLGSGAVLKIVEAVIAYAKEKHKKPSSLEEGLRWLLQDKLEFLMTREIQKGETTVQMKAFIRRGCNIYYGLHGNGDMKTLLEAYEKIPVKY